ncbi:MAG: hypothetical protein KatS3mg119_2108 [Rhodothalassiaceae bacterium]|nr:MAG: hypothetical protein KatS3mg119_2108 [Rhodothalassiaceae bacterium]
MRELSVYVDESSQSGHRFLALGGIWIEKAHVPAVERRLLGLRSRHGLSGELKWTKLSPSRRLAYEAFVDVFFALHEAGILDWHVMFPEAARIDHTGYSGGDKELGFNKFLYQFLFHRIRLYPDARPVRIYLDYRTTRHDPDRSLRPILNNALRRKLGTDSGPVAHVHFLDSKKSHLLQVNDIILGAMAYLRNDRHLGPSASAAKTAVARNILARAGLTGLSRNTPIPAKFSVWNFRLAPKKAPRDPRP